MMQVYSVCAGVPYKRVFAIDDPIPYRYYPEVDRATNPDRSMRVSHRVPQRRHCGGNLQT